MDALHNIIPKSIVEVLNRPENGDDFASGLKFSSIKVNGIKSKKRIIGLP